MDYTQYCATQCLMDTLHEQLCGQVDYDGPIEESELPNLPYDITHWNLPNPNPETKQDYYCFFWTFEEHNHDVWLIQNSWGAGWGDGGFIRLAYEDAGAGVSGMNQYIQWFTVQ